MLDDAAVLHARDGRTDRAIQDLSDRTVLVADVASPQLTSSHTRQDVQTLAHERVVLAAQSDRGSQTFIRRAFSFAEVIRGGLAGARHG